MKEGLKRPLLRRLLSKRGVWGIMCLLVAIGAFWWLTMPKEPSYQGKALSEWQRELLDEMRAATAQTDYLKAALSIPPKYSSAFKAMKKDAMPILLRQFKARDGDAQDRLAYFLVQHEVLDDGRHSAVYRNEVASLSFFAIGKEDEELITKLKELAQSGDPETRIQVWRVFAYMGIHSEAYMQILVGAVRSGTLEDRDEALSCLVILGSNGHAALPALLQAESRDSALGKKDAKLQYTIRAVSK